MDYKYLVNTGNFGALDEAYEIRILLCYMLRHVPNPLTHEQLVEVATTDDMINYFYLADAISGMKTQELVTYEKDKDGKSYYKLTDKGAVIASEFKRYIPRTLRDRIVNAAVELFAKIKRDRELKCEFIELEQGGYEVRFALRSADNMLADIRLYAPEREQARKIKRNLEADPSSFYMKIIGLALDGAEESEDESI
ncbi:MAG TPA: DUF4364 family protein [Oscillospiraceae bacterium]|nr:DUF4364 family protein [Oscillospiraceae bacterium]